MRLPFRIRAERQIEVHLYVELGFQAGRLADKDSRRQDGNCGLRGSYKLALHLKDKALPEREPKMRTFASFVSDEEIIAIGLGLLARTLPRSDWTHAAHFAAALWLLACHGEINASRATPEMIRAYNEATGVANTDDSGYHETITQASMRAAHAFLAGRPIEPLFMTCNELLSSPFGKPEWLLTYWSRPRLFSVGARRKWLEPDIQPLPF